MLIAVLLIFLATEIPQALLATLGGAFPSDVYYIIYPRIGNLMDLLSLLNSSLNFILYCAMSSRFRATFMGTLTHLHGTRLPWPLCRDLPPLHVSPHRALL